MDTRNPALANARPKPLTALIAAAAALLFAFALAATVPQTAYAGIIANGTWGTCPWDISEDGVLTIHPGKLERADDGLHLKVPSEIKEHASDITTLVFAEENGQKVDVNGTYFQYSFLGLTQVTSADFSGLDVSSLCSMSMMFDAADTAGTNTNNVKHLEYLDLSGWDTSNVTEMDAMFYGCESLKSVNISGWNTSNVTRMSGVFSGCEALTSVDVSSWNTSNVISMNELFFGCQALTGLDISNWDTSNVTTMDYMFYECQALTDLDVSNWDTSNVTSMHNMFSGCQALTDLDVSSWDTSNVTSMDYLFYECQALTDIDVSSWDTSNVTTMGGMFCDCYALESLDLSGFSTSHVSGMWEMFSNCSHLESLDLSGWDTSSATTMEYMFYHCDALIALDLSGFNTSSVTSMTNMFAYCRALQEVTLGPLFSFVGSAKLPNITANTEYTGRWSNGAVAFTAKDLAANYDSSMAGTFIRERTTPITGATIELEQYSFVYTGWVVKPDPIVIFNGVVLKNSSDYVVSYSDNYNVGEATLTVTGVNDYSGCVSGHFTITRATIEAPQPYAGLVYNGHEQTGFSIRDMSVVEGSESAKAAGNYSATVCPDGNHTWVDGTTSNKVITWSIAPAAVRVSAKDVSKTAGEADPTFEATVAGMKGGESATLIAYTLEREAGEAPGTYAITPVGEVLQGNYQVTYVPGTFTINAAPNPDPDPDPDPDPEPQKTPVAAPKAKTGLSFTGSAKTGVAAGTGFTVVGGSATNAGSYTATAKLEDGYVWDDGTSADRKVSWSIAKAANPLMAKLKVKTKAFSYAKVKKATQSVKLSKILAVSKTQGTVTYKKKSGNNKITVKGGKLSVKKGLKKGTYAVKVSVTAAGDGNYNKGSKVVTFKVKVK